MHPTVLSNSVKLFTNRLVVRSIELEDCEQTYVDWLNDPEVNQYLETRWTLQDLSSVREFVQSARQDPRVCLLAITKSDGGQHIGNIKIGPANEFHRFADVSYFIGARDSWGCGFASEALAAVVDFAFSDCGLHRLQAGVYESNGASASVLRKCGFADEGCLRSKFRSDVSFDNHLVFGILASEWQAQGISP